MNSWVIVNLGGTVGVDLLILGPYATFDEAIQGAIGTGQPWNWCPCQVWGPGPTVPGGVPAPQSVSPGAWLAVAPGSPAAPGLQLIGYGTFSNKDSAETWANGQKIPQAYQFGEVVAGL